MEKWFYDGKWIESIEDFPQGTYGFIYITIHEPSGKAYLGKKVLYYNVKKKLTKKELAEQTGRGRKPTTTTTQKEKKKSTAVCATLNW
jgi:hypothetical protein